VSDVELPPWANGSADEFIRLHVQALESEQVSMNLHHWIDLIFGFKQRGKDSITSGNAYNSLCKSEISSSLKHTNPNVIKDHDLLQRIQNQLWQIGTLPYQLFTQQHPQRLSFQQRKQNLMSTVENDDIR